MWNSSPGGGGGGGGVLGETFNQGADCFNWFINEFIGDIWDQLFM